MMKPIATLLLFYLTSNLFSAFSVELTPGVIKHPVFPPKIENVKERLIQNGSNELLKAIGWSDSSGNIALRLVHSEWIKVDAKSRIFLIFDSSGWTSVSYSPRVLALLDANYHVKFWGRFDSFNPFGYATFIQSPGEKDADLVIIDPAMRFSGELFFHRYKVSSDKISFMTDTYTWNRIK
jgi:hypothetical protein